MTVIDVAQAMALGVASAGLFLLLPLGWFLLVFGLVAAGLLVLIEHSRRPAPEPVTDVAVIEPETERA